MMTDHAAAERALGRVRALVDLLAEGYEPQWTGLEPNPDGSRTFPYVSYDGRVHEGLDAAVELAGGSDRDYLARIDAVHARPEEDLTLPELATWFTWVQRGERFVDGHIAEHLRNGEVGRRLARLLALVG